MRESVPHGALGQVADLAVRMRQEVAVGFLDRHSLVLVKNRLFHPQLLRLRFRRLHRRTFLLDVLDGVEVFGPSLRLVPATGRDSLNHDVMVVDQRAALLD